MPNLLQHFLKSFQTFRRIFSKIFCFHLEHSPHSFWTFPRVFRSIFRVPHYFPFSCFPRFVNNRFKYSQKNRRDSLETRAAFIEIPMKFTKRPKNRDHFWKYMALSEGISYLQVVFMLFRIKWMLVSFNLQRNGTENGLSNIKDTFAKASSYNY